MTHHDSDATQSGRLNAAKRPAFSLSGETHNWMTRLFSTHAARRTAGGGSRSCLLNETGSGASVCCAAVLLLSPCSSFTTLKRGFRSGSAAAALNSLSSTTLLQCGCVSSRTTAVTTTERSNMTRHTTPMWNARRSVAFCNRLREKACGRRKGIAPRALCGPTHQKRGRRGGTQLQRAPAASVGM